ncbi:ABC transporter permease [Ancylobacter defluvii]|uniref:ABC transporter permease n=1 Tax=Ancylobacter defluvii TaxID=1282440 RepID=A0A9W6NAQ8_9HYPH|nr:ABC transporter permease [Ancylobacter defluvii]MBS7589147.1 ABC transporter permease [Ancylobacter defluvii]GLK84759.1 ABC transporter permease [Ancylobacter defluvii]
MSDVLAGKPDLRRRGPSLSYAVVNTALRFSPLLLLALGWEFLGLSGLVSQQMLPGLGEIFSAFSAMLFGGDLLYNTARSISRAATGLGAAIVIGVAAGLLMASFRTVRLLINPIVQIFYPMPKSALIPVVMIWLGLGDSSKILLIFLGCLLPVVVGTYNGARGVNPFLLWSASSLGASRFEVLREVVLRAAMPDILNGCRTALAFSFILMVSSEFVIATDGVGFMISSLGDGGQYPAMFAAIFFVAGIGFAADRLYAMLSRRLLRWREA